jgi:hypothetical protein
MKALNSKFISKPKSGMIVKDERLLKPSHYYYRFAHSMVNGKTQSRDQIVGGAWWMDADTFNTIKQRAENSSTHLSDMARLNLAIAKIWGGKVDVVVRALLKDSIYGYYGIGTIIQTYDIKIDGDFIIDNENRKLSPSQLKKSQQNLDEDLPFWLPANDVIQIYIPGLKEKNPQTGNRIYQDAFTHIEQIKIGWGKI